MKWFAIRDKSAWIGLPTEKFNAIWGPEQTMASGIKRVPSAGKAPSPAGITRSPSAGRQALTRAPSAGQPAAGAAATAKSGAPARTSSQDAQKKKDEERLELAKQLIQNKRAREIAAVRKMFEGLSAQDLDKKTFETFQKIDADGNMELDMEEFGHAFEHMGLKLSVGDRDEMFREFDADGSGSVDLEEFR